MQEPSPQPFPRIAIIGSGFSGIGLGIKLLEMGIRSFTIYEKEDRVGGTWRDNVYPGAACDVPSFAYCFSFEQKVDWSRKWAPQPEILEYIDHCVERYGLGPHIRLGAEVASARWDDGRGEWQLDLGSGEQVTAHILVSGVGQLSQPYVPDIPGLGSFQGTCFHSARWERGFDPTRKRIAVVGNAASAVQLVPELARSAQRLLVFQRSANWMLPKNDREYAAWEQAVFHRLPALARMYRWWIWLAFELRFPVIRGNRLMHAIGTRACMDHLEEQVADPELRRALVPDYPIGGKRLLLSDDYYEALQRENVRVVTTGIDRVTRDAVVTRDGVEHPVDAIVLATGFRSTSFLAPMDIVGRHGRSLSHVWSEGATAYLGMTVSGFPNFFVMYGPNTNLGHNSILFMLECQIRYILDALRQMRERGLRSIDVRPQVLRAYDAEMQSRLSETVWAHTERSWYKTGAGRITNNWAGTTLEYWRRTRRADLRDYRVERRASRSRASDRDGLTGASST